MQKFSFAYRKGVLQRDNRERVERERERERIERERVERGSIG